MGQLNRLRLISKGQFLLFWPEEGHIFAFGLSEKEHGADLYSSEMTLKSVGDGKYEASGSKYYIGNANDAAYVSTFAKDEKGEYVFFVVEITNLKNHENVILPYNRDY